MKEGWPEKPVNPTFRSSKKGIFLNFRWQKLGPELLLGNAQQRQYLQLSFTEFVMVSLAGYACLGDGIV